MSIFKAGLRSYILADTDITTLIGNRCDSFPAPENETKPYIMLTRINKNVLGTVNESLNVCHELWQIDVITDSSDIQAEQIEDLLIDRLDYADRVEMGDFSVYSCTFESSIDGSELEMESSENADIRKILTFNIHRDRIPTE